MITALHSKKNRPYLRIGVYVLLVSLFFLTISAPCSMSSWLLMSSQTFGLSKINHSHHQDHSPESSQDCSFKPCLEKNSKQFSEISRLLKLDLPIFILSIICTLSYLFPDNFVTKVHRINDPPVGRRVLLIYRFCTLLN